MADETEVEDGEEVDYDAEQSCVLHDGDFIVMDPEYLDRTCEAVGVLAILHSIERGQWVLVGRGGRGEPYTQTWEAVGEPADAKGKRLRPVQ